METAKQIESLLQEISDPQCAAQSRRFFKMGPGQYGEGDQFIGIRIPRLREIANRCKTLSIPETIQLLHSPIHEARLTALLIWVRQYPTADHPSDIYRAYLQHTAHINNWDLVDVSAPHIVGAHLLSRTRAPLYDLARSSMLWERRIAILSTFAFIRNMEFSDTLALADLLLHDPEDLMHKAVGWMIREVGKRDFDAAETFLLPRYKTMPRTMLRYAIERFPEPTRLDFLHGRKEL